MKLVARKGSVTIFMKSSAWDDGVVMFIGERRFDITLSQFNKLAEASEKGGTEGFLSCCVSFGIIDKTSFIKECSFKRRAHALSSRDVHFTFIKRRKTK